MAEEDQSLHGFEASVSGMLISRHNITSDLVAALEPLDFVNAFWEAGSAAFGELDGRSDIDLLADVADGRVADAFAVIERTLLDIAPFEHRWEVPEPTPHGHAQRFYRLVGTGPHLWVDVVVMERSATARFDEIERHGVPVVFFDKLDAVRALPMDTAELERMITARLQMIRDAGPLYLSLARKEVERENPVAAISLYHALALRPLIELLRMKHCPYRFDFGARYLERDLPADVRERLVNLAYPRGVEDVGRMLDIAQTWILSLLEELDPAEIIEALVE